MRYLLLVIGTMAASSGLMLCISVILLINYTPLAELLLLNWLGAFAIAGGLVILGIRHEVD